MSTVFFPSRNDEDTWHLFLSFNCHADVHPELRALLYNVTRATSGTHSFSFFSYSFPLLSCPLLPSFPTVLGLLGCSPLLLTAGVNGLVCWRQHAFSDRGVKGQRGSVVIYRTRKRGTAAASTTLMGLCLGLACIMLFSYIFHQRADVTQRLSWETFAFLEVSCVYSFRYESVLFITCEELWVCSDRLPSALFTSELP